MKIYPEDYTVSVTFPFTDLNGDAVTPTSVTAVLYNGGDEVVVDLGAITFAPGDTSVEIMVPAAYNVLGVGQLSAARILRVELATAAGVIRKSFAYIVEGEFRLAVMNNSFQTYEAAEIVARDIPNLNGWAAADFDRKCTAMIEAAQCARCGWIACSICGGEPEPVEMKLDTEPPWGALRTYRCSACGAKLYLHSKQF